MFEELGRGAILGFTLAKAIFMWTCNEVRRGVTLGFSLSKAVLPWIYNEVTRNRPFKNRPGSNKVIVCDNSNHLHAGAKVVTSVPSGQPSALPRPSPKPPNRGGGYQPIADNMTPNGPPRTRSGFVSSNPNPLLDRVQDMDRLNMARARANTSGRSALVPQSTIETASQLAQRIRNGPREGASEAVRNFLQREREIEKNVICTGQNGRQWKTVNGKRVYLDLYDKIDKVDDLIIEDD